MLLSHLNNNSQKKLNKINRYLNESFGFTLKSNVKKEILEKMYKSLEQELYEMKVNNLTPQDSEYSKKLLMKEGISFLLENTALPVEDIKNKVVSWLCDYACKCINIGDSIDDSVNDAMRHYRSSKYRFPDQMIEQLLRDRINEKMGGVRQPTTLYDNMEETAPLVGVAEGSEPELGTVKAKLMKTEKPTVQVQVFKHNTLRGDNYWVTKEVKKFKTMKQAQAYINRVNKQADYLGTADEVADAVLSQIQDMYPDIISEVGADYLGTVIDDVAQLHRGELTPDAVDRMVSTVIERLPDDIYESLQDQLKDFIKKRKEIDPDSTITLVTPEVKRDRAKELERKKKKQRAEYEKAREKERTRKKDPGPWKGPYYRPGYGDPKPGDYVGDSIDYDLKRKFEAYKLSEKAPPGMEDWIKDRKEEFKKRYGDRWEEVLYATAWKMANRD